VGHGRNKRKIKRFLVVNENENLNGQNLWDIAKAFLEESS
jgi:hypothetical protein